MSKKSVRKPASFPQLVQELLDENGIADSVWGVRITDAGKRGSVWGGEFARKDFGLAREWVTCACGEAGDIPRHSNGEPLDPTMRSLGVDFLSHVGCNEVGLAAKVLVAIEKRARELLVGGGS